MIRKATMEDLDRIAALEAACFPAAEAAGKGSFEERLRFFADRFWLLEEEGQLISMIDGMASDEEILRDEMYEQPQLHDPEGDWQMIFGVETLPAYQGRGYASRLMQAVIDEVRAQGKKGLVLTCKKEKIPFYERFGYQCEGESASCHGGAKWYDMRLRF